MVARLLGAFRTLKRKGVGPVVAVMVFPSDFGSARSGSPELNSPSPARFGLLIQGFAIFVPLSILFGRIHFLRYYEELGISTSRISINVAEYAIISPGTTILSVGLTIIAAFSLWWYRSIDVTDVWRMDRILWGLVLSAVGVTIGAFDSLIFSAGELQFSNSATFGLWKLIPLTMALTGGFITASGYAYGNRATEDGDTFKFRRLFVPLLAMFYVVVLLLVAASYAKQIGETDAEATLRDAPKASIVVSYPLSPSVSQYWPEGCREESSHCNFRVLLIDDNFIYLKSENSESPYSESIHAVPIGDVKSIVYAPIAKP